MPKIDKRIIIGYSNLLYFISTIYFFDIRRTKKVDIKIKIFEYKENLSIVKLSLKIFAGSLSPFKIIKVIKKITKSESL